MILEKCPNSNDLRAFSLGQLDEARSDEMLGHVQACDTCQGELDASDVEDTFVQNLRSTDPDEFAEEGDCKVALVKALGALASPDAVDHSELSELLPKVLGDYEIVRSLGRGGMGNVYLARHQKLGRQVALKILSSHRLLQPRMRQRFETEMRAVGQLQHPNIVTAYDAREVDDLGVLVTEYIDGLDVGQVLRRQDKISLADACEIAKQTADALEYVNDQGLVHRDVKPSNVMLGRDGSVKLLDLGLARLRLGNEERPDMTATGQAMGTADYIAPEQVNDSRGVDIRADIYSLGCTLFKMLSGVAPFGSNEYVTSFAKMTAHVSEEPPTLQSVAPDVPTELATLVDRMLAKSVLDRPQSAKEVSKTLSRFATRSNLSRLVEDALNQSIVRGLEETRSGQPPIRPTALPWYSRRVPILVAIGAAMGGIVLGTLLGITITIKQPDGSENQVQLPAGANALVQGNGDVTIGVPGTYPVLDGDVQDAAAMSPLATLERLQGIWRPVSWGHEVQGPGTANVLFVFNEGKFFPIFDSQFVQDPVPFTVESTKTFSVLNCKMPGNQDLNATIRFLAKDRFQMSIAAEPTTVMERLSGIPIEASAIERLKQDAETALFAKPVKMVDAYLRTGKLPGTVAKRAADVKRRKSHNNLRQLTLGLLNHESAHAEFPASVNHGKVEGWKPISWRVKILPFLEEVRLYEMYRLDEEWDSPNNLKVLAEMPDVFRRPGDDADSTDTHYLAVAGNNAVIATDKPRHVRDVTDGLSKSVLLVESSSGKPWTKPDDVSIEEVLGWVKADGFEGLDVAFADGAVRFLKGKLAEPKNLRALMTRAGNDAARVELHPSEKTP